jgi:tetratricopeptide (TPR) repeat protein
MKQHKIIADKSKRLFNQALQLQQHSKLDEAKALYEKILYQEPHHCDALHLLGTIYKALNQNDKAITLIRQAIQTKQHPVYYNSLGVILKSQGKIDDAIEALRKAVLIDPHYADAHYNLGITLQNRGKLDEAIEAYTQALLLNPQYAEAHNNIGVALYSKGQIDRAIEVFIKALSIHPHYAEAYYNLGNALQSKNKVDHAITAYEKALLLNPQYVDAYNNLGVVLKAQGKIEKAIESYTKALSINPHHAGVYNNLGAALKEQGKLEEAIAIHTKALSLDPNYADAYSNLGNALYDNNKVDESLEAYAKALSLDPNHVGAAWNQSLAMLLSGDLVEGFKVFEYRWDVESGLQKFRRNFSQPLWLGEENICGKTILIHAEQGLGDTLQFCRYIEMLAHQGAHIIFEVPRPLIRLLQNLKGISTLIEKGSPLPTFDYHCPLLSLPLVFHTSLTNVPAPNAYIHVDQTVLARWEKALGEKRALRVGLVWNGGFRANQPALWYANNRRNIPLELIVKLNRADVDFYSLQKGEPAESEFKRRAPELWKGDNLFSFMDDVEDFADTAGLISQLDLVIAVDTSTAHLAAAMGKPVWLLNRFDTCWRWMLHREDSPWYPTLTLFRQPSFGDWESVMQKVKDRLDALVLSQVQK